MNNQIVECFDSIAKNYDRYRRRNRFYHKRIEKFYRQVIPQGSTVLEIGCAVGELLASVKPSYGLGIDISGNMIKEAKMRYPHLDFIHGDISALPARRDFDFIILSNLLDYVDDLYMFFEQLKNWMHDGTKILINNINPLWAPLIWLAARFWLRVPEVKRNFITLLDICNILEILNFDILERGYRLLLPFYVPFISTFLNKLLPRLYGINVLSSTQYAICKKKQVFSKRETMSCTVIVPCHNEEGNIEECVRRIPRFGSFTEIIVVDDGSTDRTFQIARELSAQDSRVHVIRLEKNLGKGNAVRTGFDNAAGDALIIMDADMSVAPEEIPKFFNAIADGQAEFVNGTRMLYPIEKEAMKFANYLGNKTFGIIASVIMGQRNTDTLCGTKALLRHHYRHIKMEDCKWGDFDLLYGAAKLKLKMVEMPVHYKKRISGVSKMKAIRHGLGMLKSCFVMFWGLE